MRAIDGERRFYSLCGTIVGPWLSVHAKTLWVETLLSLDGLNDNPRTMILTSDAIVDMRQTVLCQVIDPSRM